MDLARYSEPLSLPDGGPFRIRAIRPADRGRLLEAFLALSPLSVRYRFLQSKDTLTDSELAYYTELDFTTHVGLVAVMEESEGERIASVGRFSVLDPEAPIKRAEFGIAVIDEFQGRGLGSAMMKTLAKLARIVGVSEFEAYALGENTRFLAFLEKSGYRPSLTCDENTIHLSFPIAGSDETPVTPKVGCETFVRNERSEICLVKREDNGLWAMPGGYQELGETTAECARREFEEETGLEIRVTALLGVFSSIRYENRTGVNRWGEVTHLLFRGEVIGGRERTSEETTAVDWFTPKNLPPLSDGHEERVRHSLKWDGTSTAPHFE